MEFTFELLGTRVGVALRGAVPAGFPGPWMGSFLAAGEGADVRLILTVLPAAEGPGGGDLARAHPAVGARYRGRGADELVWSWPHHLALYDPRGRVMEVYQRELAGTVDVIEGYLRRLVGGRLARQGDLLLHGAGFTLGGAAAAAIGPSGAGKSTAARLMGADFLLSDDVVAVADCAGAPTLHATPLGGATDGAASGPLRALFFPRQAERFALRPMAPREALPRYWAEHWEYHFWYLREEVGLVFANAHALFGRVPAYELAFAPDGIDRAAIGRALSGRGGGA